MPNSLDEIIPTAEDLLALQPEELAGILLQLLNSIPGVEKAGWLHPGVIATEKGPQGYPAQFRDEIGRALMEAWLWLEKEGLVALRPYDLSTGWYFITRRGRQITSPDQFASYRHSALLPRRVLHPNLAEKMWAPFLRGDYDAAVFQAFKEIEIVVRDRGGFQPADIGVNLMRQAFDKDRGPLADRNLPDAEREAMAHLFAGAIGLYKNPQSHRNVEITNPADAVGLIMFANHLLHIVDRLSTQRV